MIESTQQAVSPAEAVFRLSNGMSVAAIVLAAARLRIADAVGAGPETVAQIAAKLDANPDALTRMLRALAAFGIFRQVNPTTYVHTDMSLAMRTDHPDRLHDRLMTGGDWGWTMWGKLPEAIRTGECAFDKVYGTDFFSYLDADPAAQDMIYSGVTAWSDQMLPSIVDALDLNGVRTFADMGGGKGALLRMVLQRYPDIEGLLYEDERTLRVVLDDLRTGELANRCRLASGDFFEKVEHAADLYLFKLTLHMYDDEKVAAALRNCAQAAAPGARVVIADPLLTDPPVHPFASSMDLHMLLVMGGRERTEGDYKAVFERAGLRFRGVTPTDSVLHLAEGEVVA
ncbi:methyltransferase [Nonomuraea sp. PA05]|uniref:methyltransferase n=1 Tax=Nonomuraea sp. PA05 TaxID=2604466 RepID=UPI0011DAFC91|nr:methyltransferase [Nonomuraea sp. PA05]TYB60556.1 methyltransferase [Nonomuraea sp. PA05]